MSHIGDFAVAGECKMAGEETAKIVGSIGDLRKEWLINDRDQRT